MAREVIRLRNARLIVRFGWLRVVFDFALPVLLALAAIISLSIKFW